MAYLSHHGCGLAPISASSVFAFLVDGREQFVAHWITSAVNSAARIASNTQRTTRVGDRGPLIGIVGILSWSSLRAIHPRDVRTALHGLDSTWLAIAALATLLNIAVMGLYDVIVFEHTRSRWLERCCSRPYRKVEKDSRRWSP